MKLHNAIPILRVFDEALAQAFYVDFLGFNVDWQFRFEPDFPLFEQVSLDNCVLNLSEHHGDGTPGTCIRIECDDLKEYVKYIQSKKYKHANPQIIEQAWEHLELKIKDPFGNMLIFFEIR